jgi:hypothetical protein
MNGKPIAIITATTASTIHSAHTSVLAHSPHTGTHSIVHSCSSVANPIGTEPRNSECTGSRSITLQISGHSAYRSAWIARNVKKRTVLSAK